MTEVGGVSTASLGRCCVVLARLGIRSLKCTGGRLHSRQYCALLAAAPGSASTEPLYSRWMEASADATEGQTDLPVLPGRLQRLNDELAEEAMPVFDGAPDPVAALVELAYALRPRLHEGRVPVYGVLIPPTPSALIDLVDLTNTSLRLVSVADLDSKFARRFADGVSSFAVRTGDQITHLACFGRNMADEYDLVGLQSAAGGLIVQRHPGGQVRVFGPAGVVRWNGVSWRHDPPVDAWVSRLQKVVSRSSVDGVQALLRFAIHELAGRRIGATLIWRRSDDEPPEDRTERLVHNAPRLSLRGTGEEAAVAMALAQTDGAATFDRSASLTAIGVRLAPSAEAEQAIPRMEGMRHTSALRYSYDDRDAIVIVVSEDGMVTLMYHGEAIKAVDPSAVPIG